MPESAKAVTKSQPRMMAAPSRQKIKPAFTVQKLDGTYEQRIIKFDDKGKRRETFVEADAGFMVTISKGDSFRVTTAAELHRLGFDDVVPMVDDDGEIVSYMDNPIAADIRTGEKK